jgi:hypothetical protein
MDWLAISSGVQGRCGDMVGVWAEPVMAQVMMTLLELAMVPPFALLLPWSPNPLSEWPGCNKRLLPGLSGGLVKR